MDNNNFTLGTIAALIPPFFLFIFILCAFMYHIQTEKSVPNTNTKPTIQIIVNDPCYKDIDAVKKIIQSEDFDNLLGTHTNDFESLITKTHIDHSIIQYKDKKCILFDKEVVREKEIQQFIQEIYKEHGYCDQQCQ